MKHIKKKYLDQVNNSEIVFQNYNENVDIKKLKRVPDDKDLYMLYSGGLAFKTMLHKVDGRTMPIPIPDLSLVYYDSAYNLNLARKKEQKALFDKVEIRADKEVGDEAIHEIYRFYGLASSCLISLFTSLESFINHMIPDKGLYTVKTKKNTETYNKEQIQKYLTFDVKVKDVLPFFNENKNFFKNPSIANVQHLNNLKNIRDEIVHPKSGNQETLIKQVLNFNYDKSIEAVAAFMNFYCKGYIEECPCGLDY